MRQIFISVVKKENGTFKKCKIIEVGGNWGDLPGQPGCSRVGKEESCTTDSLKRRVTPRSQTGIRPGKCEWSESDSTAIRKTRIYRRDRRLTQEERSSSVSLCTNFIRKQWLIIHHLTVNICIPVRVVSWSLKNTKCSSSSSFSQKVSSNRLLQKKALIWFCCRKTMPMSWTLKGSKTESMCDWKVEAVRSTDGEKKEFKNLRVNHPK